MSTLRVRAGTFSKSPACALSSCSVSSLCCRLYDKGILFSRDKKYSNIYLFYFIELYQEHAHTWLCIYSNTSQKVHSLVGLHVKHRHTNTYAHFNTCITTHTMCARVHTLLISHKHVRLRRGAPDAFQSPCLGTTSLDTQQS